MQLHNIGGNRDNPKYITKQFKRRYSNYIESIKGRNIKMQKKNKKKFLGLIFMLERFLQGANDNLIPEMLNSNNIKYCNFLSLTPILIEKLLVNQKLRSSMQSENQLHHGHN